MIGILLMHPVINVQLLRIMAFCVARQLTFVVTLGLDFIYMKPVSIKLFVNSVWTFF